MTDQFDHIRDTYNVPARNCARVEFTDSNGKTHTGTITGVKGPHILVKMDDAESSLPYHPTWGMRYLEHDHREAYLGRDSIPDRG